MSVERIIHVVAGFFIVLSVVLSGAPLNEPTWLWFTLFVGVNLFQSGLTQWCLMGIILKKLGLKSDSACKTC